MHLAFCQIVFGFLPDPLLLVQKKCTKLHPLVVHHNYLVSRSSMYLTPTLVDRYDANENVVDGDWRQNFIENASHPFEHHRSRNDIGKDISDELANYFVNEEKLVNIYIF